MYALHQVALLFILNALSAPAGSLGLHQRMAAAESHLMDIPAQRRMDALSTLYLESVDPATLAGTCSDVTGSTAEDLFEATAMVALYRRDVEWVSRTSCLHNALLRTGMAGARHHQRMHALLVSIHQFDQANDFRLRYSIDVPVLPEIPASNAVGLSVVRMVGDDGFQPGSIPYASQAGVQVVAIVHPYCGFSKRALDVILRDAEYGWLRPRLQLVVARESIWPEKAVRAWSSANPLYPMQMQGMGAGWEMLDTLETPIFHLLSNGRLILSVKGWSGDGSELEPLRVRLQELE